MKHMGIFRCQRCSNEFKRASRYNVTPKYCSRVCQYNPKVVRDCETCGTEFSRKPSIAGQYCSVACLPGRKYQPDKHTTKKCPGCKNDFVSHNAWPTHHCSRECRAIATTLYVDCPTCGVNFKTYHSDPRIHCSQKCYSISCRIDPDHVQGIFYYGPKWKEIRKEMLERDNNVCTSCGKNPSEYRALHIHHVIPVREFDKDDFENMHDRENLLTLCVPCHLDAHEGKSGRKRKRS